MREADYQRRLISILKRRFPGCVVVKNDSAYLQGFPDLTIFWMDKWACLEVKADLNAREQPNQRYYVELLNNMSFAAFICLANEKEVLDALQHAFQPRRATRVPRS